MHPTLILFFALSIAFTWVEILRWGNRKPFNCIKCMTGWIALIIAGSVQADYWPLYLFGGLFVGAVFDIVKMRYL